MAELINKLIATNRLDDIKRAVKEEEYRAQLMQEMSDPDPIQITSKFLNKKN